MVDNQASEKRSKKPFIIVVCAILSIVLLFLIISTAFSGKESSESSASKDSVYAQDSAATAQKITEATTTAGTSIGGDIAVGEIGNQNSSDATVKVTAEKVEAPAASQGSSSKFIKGATTVKKWNASSVISKVTAEKIIVPLNVYDENGKKTDQVKKRYLYVAQIDTRPSRVCVLSANQFTKATVAYMTDIVKGYEKEYNQDILFATTNEMCARDYDNPQGKVFYNGNDTLTATVIKNGEIAQRGDPSRDSLLINKSGEWQFPCNVSMSTASDLIKSGTIASVSYTYPVIWKGQKYNHPDTGVNTGIWSDHEITDGVNKTLIGKIGTDRYIVTVSSGFGYGYMAEYMLNDLGVEDAYWGNGGVSAAMYIKGYGIVTPNDYEAHGDLFCIR